MRRLTFAALLVLTLSACSPGEATPTTEPEPATTTTELPLPTSAPPLPPMEVTSPAFDEGGDIPAKYTCDGADVSPRLDILYPPTGTASLAIIVDDPDSPVGTWDHWVEYDVPHEGGDASWPEDAGRVGVPGVNSWNVTGYGGPCPPEGENHRYFFTVFALDSELLIPEGVDSAGLREAMEGKILAEAGLTGTYSR